jgi:hypothetical protein
VDLVLELARARDARVKGLGEVEPGRSVRLEKAVARGGQTDGVVARSGTTRGLDQPLLAEVAQVARAWVRGRAAGVEPITTGDHPERADGFRRARLLTPQRVFTTAVVHNLAFGPAWEIHVALEHVSC